MARRRALTFDQVAKLFEGLPSEILGDVMKSLASTMGKKYVGMSLDLDYEIIEEQMIDLLGFIDAGLPYDEIISKLIKGGKIDPKIWKAINKSIIKHIPVDGQKEILRVFLSNSNLYLLSHYNKGEILPVGDEKPLDNNSHALPPEPRAKRAEELVDQYIDAIKSLKHPSPILEELQFVTKISSKTWNRNLNNRLFLTLLKMKLHQRQSGKYSKSSESKELWKDAEVAIDNKLETVLLSKDALSRSNNFSYDDNKQFRTRDLDDDIASLFQSEVNR